MAEKSVKANYIYNAAYQVLTLITPLITTPYLSRILEADGIGTYSFVYSVMSYFLLFAEMGISSYGSRRIAYFKDNRAERSKVFWNLKCLSLINVCVCMTAYTIFSFMYAGDNLGIYLVTGIYIFNLVIDPVWLFSGMEEFGIVIAVSIVTRLLSIVFVFLFIKQKSDLTLHIGGIIFFIILSSTALWAYLPKYIDKPEIKSIKPFTDIKIIWILFVPGIASQIAFSLDKIMLGVFTGSAFENGYYEQALRISILAMMLISSLGTVITPRISYLFGKQDNGQIQSYMYVSYKFIWFLGTALCLGLFGISDNLVPWFFGKGYEKVTGLLKISCFMIPAIGINNTTGNQYLNSTSRESICTRTIIGGALVNFMLNILLIRKFLSYGAVIASVAAEVFIAICQFYVIRNELNVRKIILSGKNYFLSGIIMLIFLRVVNNYLSPSIIHTFMMIFAGAVIYLTILLILRDEFFIDYSQRTLRGIAARLNR